MTNPEALPPSCSIAVQQESACEAATWEKTIHLAESSRLPPVNSSHPSYDATDSPERDASGVSEFPESCGNDTDGASFVLCCTSVGIQGRCFSSELLVA